MQYIHKSEAIILLTGSNQGDSKQILEAAKGRLDERLNGKSAASSLFISPPWGFEADNEFLNQALVYQNHRSKLSPLDLMVSILDIETEFGRQRTESIGYESRTLDIDIIAIGNREIMHPKLTVPHPRLQVRRFVLAPICDVAPHLVHPSTGLTYAELLSQCPDESVVQKMLN